MLPQDGLDVVGIQAAAPGRKAERDPLCLGGELVLLEVLLAPCSIEEDDRDEPAARHEPDEQQPPLELGHQRWPAVRRIGSSLRGSAPPRRVPPRLNSGLLVGPLHSATMINITPDPVAIQIGPLPVYWYGVAYAVGLAVSYLVLVRQARRFGQDPELVGNGIIVIAVAALIGGRLYHVIDQWVLYRDDPLKIILPPYSGLGVYGGLITGFVAFVVLVRYHRVNPWIWADIVAPALFTMQAIGRWGNFFNQELYGPPTSLPWGIRIDEAHRVAPYLDVVQYPVATTHFHPLFLYESVSGIVGALFLIWLGRRRSSRLVPGDLLLIFFIWYGLTRFALEGLRSGNWTFFGVPTAQIVTAAFISIGVVGLLYRHGRGHPGVTAAELLPDPAAATSREDAEDAFWDDDEQDELDDELDEDLDDDLDDEQDHDPAEDLGDDAVEAAAVEAAADEAAADHLSEPDTDPPRPDRPAAPD